MSTVTDLIEQGITRIRLPEWNENAYVEMDPDPASGPWATLYDVLVGIGGGEPRKVLYVTLAQDERWEPHQSDGARHGRPSA